MINEQLQSQTINLMRFPLIVGVVLIHSSFDGVVINGVNLMQGGGFPIYTYASYLISDVLSAISVPLFFFISGFLFFYKTPSFTGQIYLHKLKRRAKTIFIPYVFWNLLVIVLFFLSQSFFPDLMSGKKKLIVDYSFTDWLFAFWNSGMTSAATGPNPICYQFWFIRDLMVVMLFSPLIHFLLTKFRLYAVLCLGLLWFFGWWFDIVGFNITAFFFFSTGAYFSIHKNNFVETMKPLFHVSILVYAIIAVAELCFMNQAWHGYLHNVGILVGITAAVTTSTYFVQKRKWRTSLFLSSSSFFIYAYHAMPLAFIFKFFYKLVKPHSDGVILTLYILCPTITILIGLFIYKLMKKYLPRTTALVTGGR